MVDGGDGKRCNCCSQRQEIKSIRIVLMLNFGRSIISQGKITWELMILIILFVSLITI